MSEHVGHEPTDVRARPLVAAAGLIVAVIVLTVVVQALLVRWFESRAERTQGPEAPLAGSPDRMPPEPRLLAEPAVALDELRRQEDELLNGWAWINREAGVVRIPIDRAIDILAERHARPGR